MKNFGVFKARQGNPEKNEDRRFTYYDNADGIEWDIFFSKSENKANWYLAVDQNGQINCCDQNPMNVRSNGYTIVGLDNIGPWTNNEGGTIYGCRLDLENNKILQPPLPNITKRQIKLWLLQQGKNPKTYPDELITKITDKNLQIQAEIEWEDGDTYNRDSDFIKALIHSMGWNDKDVDKVWNKMVSIE